MELTSRLNVLRYDDVEARTALIGAILGRPMPETLTLYPPFFCDYGLNLDFGEGIFVNQNCSFYDLGGITIGDHTMIGPGVTLTTAGHPVEPSERFDGITTAPIVIESNVWIGTNATITPGVRVGSGSVVAAGAVIAKDVPPNCIVSSGGYVKRRELNPATLPSCMNGGSPSMHVSVGAEHLSLEPSIAKLPVRVEPPGER